ncbi:UDP-N-acetylmuramoyl-L-alanine--D-glutamate ligase [Candidatus Pelagibacter bacterium]|nr:UDP-N-acetylmuramoyl-L-alanine--D-glutamate ligase [Candidatus Pelagibacter bacterium]
MRQILELKELSFLVYGLGISGMSVVKFFKKNKIKKFKVWDDTYKKLYKKHRAKNLKQVMKQVDYIVLSPGISLVKNKNFIKFKKKIITDIDLFFLTKNKCKSIVITGTNGKSTTCKLLAHLLKKNRFKCSLGGNIGNPILEVKNSKNSYVIIEASSFQLAHSKFISPDYAFFLNLTNDHLDWHGTMKNYLNSKLKIFQLQSKNSFALINKKFKKTFSRRKFLSKTIVPKIENYKKIKFKIKNDYLTSKINDENMSFVYAFAKLINIGERSFVKSIKSFKGLSHRFEVFFKKKDVTFINDSKATSFRATELALSSLKNIYWILGGLPKKNDKIKLSKFKNNIVKCYLIGKNINFFRKQIKGKINFSVSNNLKKSIIQISKDIKLKERSERSVLFSPAAASFDQFNNFEKRGQEFKKLCKKYARKFN